jgi:hypothetical protein
VPAVPLVAFFGLAWVAEHIIEVAIVSGVCGVLAVAAVVALMRWQDRRQAARGPLMTYRAEPAGISRPPADPGPLSSTAPGQIRLRPAPPAIEQHVHFHFDPADHEALRVIRSALPGTAGDATTGKE